MFAFLKDWVREIVILLILVTFIDLALPNSAIKRYVDYTVGLILLLLLLTPVVHLLGTEIDVTSMLAMAELQSGKTLALTQPISDKSSWLAYKLLLENRIMQLLNESKLVATTSVAVSIDQNPVSVDFGNPTNIEVSAVLLPSTSEDSIENLTKKLQDIILTTFGLERTRVRIYIE